MAYNVDEEVRVLRQGQGLSRTQVIPPRRAGPRSRTFSGSTRDTTPRGAKALLDKFGYIDRDKDGWRDLPDGKPLVLKMGTSPIGASTANTTSCGSGIMHGDRHP